MQLAALLLLCMDSEQWKGEYIFREPQEEKAGREQKEHQLRMSAIHFTPTCAPESRAN